MLQRVTSRERSTRCASMLRAEVRERELLTEMMQRHLPEVNHPLLSEQSDSDSEKERKDGEGVLFPPTATGAGV
jgi:hypothetical protein